MCDKDFFNAKNALFAIAIIGLFYLLFSMHNHLKELNENVENIYETRVNTQFHAYD